MLWGAGASLEVLLPWWASFLVLMIVGERIQFGKLAYLPRTGPIVALLAMLLLTGSTAALAWPSVGMAIAGVAMVAIGTWLVVDDVTRRARRPGLLWFVSVGLAAGYAWLVASGVIWAVVAHAGVDTSRDAAIHALFQGFVMGMVITHAPMIFPAVTGQRMPFHRVFHVHLVLLHGGLALRVGGDLAGLPGLTRAGATISAAALALFVLATATSVLIGRFSAPTNRVERRAATAPRTQPRRPAAKQAR